jgi:periplasmic divalent cation tolerance protein
MRRRRTEGGNGLVIVVSTYPSMTLAEALGHELVEEDLAACVNLLKARSIFKWKGDREDVEDVFMIAKTRRGLCGKLK